MKTTNVPLFTNYSMVQDGYSAPFDLEMVTGYSIQAVWSGTPTGILFIQVSDDDAGSSFNPVPTNWTLMDPSLVNTEGVAGNHLWKQHMAPFRWIRFGYAFGSGSGTLNARLNCKGTT